MLLQLVHWSQTPASPVCPQVPDVWWWPWPAVTGVADCLSCPVRNQEDWPGSSLWSSEPSVSLWLRLHDHWSQQASAKGVNLTLPPKRRASPSWHRVWFESVDLCKDSITLPKTYAWMNITAPSCIDSVSAFISVCFGLFPQQKMFWKQTQNSTIKYLMG